MAPPPHPAQLEPGAVVAVAGATGWLGSHVVAAAAGCGLRVRALARPPSVASARSTLPQGTDVVAADLTDSTSLSLALHGAAAVINCVGVRDMAVPDVAIARVLRDGTLALWRAAVEEGLQAFVTIAGGIHRHPDGRVNREMVHNRAREAALDDIFAEAAARTSAGLPAPAVTVVDASVFFKDAASIFDMVARPVKAGGVPALTLISGGYGVRCNPISGRDLAARMVACLAAIPPEGGRVREAGKTGAGWIFERRCRRPPARSPINRPPPHSPPNRPPPNPDLPPQIRVGGPETLDFAGLADAAARALGAEACVKRSLPRWVARASLAAARSAAALGSKRALGLARFLTFLWVVCTDASPGGLVGEATGVDRVGECFAERAAALRAGSVVGGAR